MTGDIDQGETSLLDQEPPTGCRLLPLTFQGNSTVSGLAGAAVLALATLFCFCAAFLPAQAAAAGSISGTVTDAATYAAIEGIDVCAIPIPEDGSVIHCTTTDGEGEYTMSLEPHGYTVVFEGEALGYRPQWYDHSDYWWQSEKVVVGSEPVKGINAAMGPFGRIEGLVQEAESGDPLKGVRVCARQIPDGWLGGCTETDSAGEYTISNVREGDYGVEFRPAGNQLTQFYEEKTESSEADSVLVGPGAVVTGIDAHLLRAAKLEGVVRRPNAWEPFAAAEVCAWSNEVLYRCGVSQVDGTYSISGLPTAEYKIEFRPLLSIWHIQFWDHKASWDEADLLPLVAGTTTTGIDADLQAKEIPHAQWTPPSPLVTQLPATSSIQPVPRRRHCRKGFRRKRVAGKVRCVRNHKRRRHAA
jgi:hypothetical protein